MAMIQLGYIKELLESEEIWKCAQCLACTERCPREVSPYDAIQALQNLAFERNHFPKGYSLLINSILKEGLIQKPTKVKIRKHKSPEDKTSRAFEFGDRNTLSLPETKKPTNNTFSIALKKALEGEEK